MINKDNIIQKNASRLIIKDIINGQNKIKIWSKKYKSYRM